MLAEGHRGQHNLCTATTGEATFKENICIFLRPSAWASFATSAIKKSRHAISAKPKHFPIPSDNNTWERKDVCD